MPTYEFSLILKHAMKRPELVAAVKRTGEEILASGGYIRNIEFLGHRNLPQKKHSGGEVHTKGSYFVMCVDLKTQQVSAIMDFAKRDAQVLQHDLIGVKPKEEPVCTLDEELLPPSQRPSVQAMIEIGRKRPKYRRIFEHKTGLGFYPLYK